jgi:hypothetical protein
MQDFERLGVFYLGRNYDIQTGQPKEEPVLYDSKDLVTHAVCLGMTGSGKTGLCIALIEEAAIDGIPVIAIDPKGDLTNLLLTFPELSADEFAPWVNPDEAVKKGLPLDQFAAQQAQFWKKGLAEWGQSGERVQRLRQSADFVIYTPGSSSGVPLSMLKSFEAPETSLIEDSEIFNDRVRGTVTSLLGLLGIEADPLQSREHILLSTLLKTAWDQGNNLDLPRLIALIQNPGINRIGVLDLESFYPSAERFSLALRINNLLAAPGFETWLNGEPLAVDRLLYTPDGKPKVSVISIAHLSDPERMFVVSLLLNQVLSWVRSQSGTSSLRALLYMDEIFGYFPPVANPPSKLPLLTLLKQARAFGLGVVLATQNPVDLDYKGLSNTGTWFIGRLQTERDKARVIDGLEGAASSAGSSFNREEIERILSGLGSRIFLMNNVHEDAPVILNTRWTLSYLRGPLSRTQIKTLMQERKPGSISETAIKATGFAAAGAAASIPAQQAAIAARGATAPPVLPPELTQYFIPYRGQRNAGDVLCYIPAVLGIAKVLISDPKKGIQAEIPVSLLAEISESAVAVDWPSAAPMEISERELEKVPAEECEFADLPAFAAKAKNYELWKRSFVDTLYRLQKIELLQSPSAKLWSNPGESEKDFRLRLQQSAREDRDGMKDNLRKKYAARIASLEERIRRAQLSVERETQQATQQKLQTAISVGTTLLGAFLGRKSVSSSTLGRATTAVRGAGRTLKESQDIQRAEESVAALNQQLGELNAEFEAEVQALESRTDPLTENLDPVVLRPRKSDVSVALVTLAWAPGWRSTGGAIVPAYR